MFLKQSLFVLLLLIITLISVSSAGAVDDIQEIFSNWVARGGNFTTDSQVFRVQTTAADGERVVVSLKDEMVMVDNSSCEELGPYFICYMGTKFLEYDKTTDKAIDQFNIIVKKRMTKIGFTKRSVSKANPYLWEEIEITTRFENTGIINVRQANFSETFSRHFRVIKAGVCTYNASQVWWEGPIPQDSIVECTYTLKPVNVTSITLLGSITFTDTNGKAATVKTDSLAINVQKPMLQLNSTILEGDGARLGKEAVLTVTLTNVDPLATVTLTKFDITPENGLSVLRQSINLVNDGAIYRYSGRISPNGKVRLNMTIVPKESGRKKVDLYTLYFIDGKRIDNTQNEELDIRLDDLNGSVRADNATLGKDGRIRIMVMNYGYHDTFKDITVWVTSPIAGLDREYEVNEVLPKSHKVVVDGTFPFPDAANVTDFPINLDIEYHTIYGQPIYKHYNFTVRASLEKAVNETGQASAGSDGTTAPIEDTTPQPQIQVMDVITSRGFKVTLIGIGIAASVAIVAFIIIRIINKVRGSRLKEELLPPPVHFENPNKGGFLTEFENQPEDGDDPEKAPGEDETTSTADVNNDPEKAPVAEATGKNKADNKPEKSAGKTRQPRKDTKKKGPDSATLKKPDSFRF